LEHVIAHRLPAVDEVLFLSAASRLPSGTIMGMQMRSAVGNGILQLYVPLKSLMQIPSLRNVDGNPTAVLGLFGVDVKAWQRSKGSADGIDFVLILLAGMPGPIAGGGQCVIRTRVTTE